MIGQHQVRAIRDLITDLIPSCEVTCTKEPMNQTENTKVVRSGAGSFVGMLIKDSIMELWLQIDTKSRYRFTVCRDINFTRAEKQIVRALLEICRSIPIEDTNLVEFTQKSLSSRFTIPYFLVAYFMRGINPSRLGTSVSALVSLQQLSYHKYEGEVCTSGFLCLKSISNTIPERLSKITSFIFEPFKLSGTLSEDFFAKPLSYRYVDGKNSFYVVDNHGQLQGVIRNKSPKHFDLIDRCIYKHIEELKHIPGFRWIAYSGIHNDVLVHTKKGLVFQWDQNIWKNREISVISNQIISFGVTDSFAEELVNVLVTLSELRMGALLLITKDNRQPNTIGEIDTSPLGSALHTSLQGKSFDYLRKTNSIINLLTSDGMTTFDISGNLLNSGSIIDLSGERPTEKVVGGGRSQAACAASMYGMSIKVSEDGPITLYMEGKKIFEWK